MDDYKVFPPLSALFDPDFLILQCRLIIFFGIFPREIKWDV